MGALGFLAGSICLLKVSAVYSATHQLAEGRRRTPANGALISSNDNTAFPGRRGGKKPPWHGAKQLQQDSSAPISRA